MRITCSNCGKEKPHYAKELCELCYKRQWRAEHPERVKASSRAWRTQHPERARAFNRAWRENNPEKVRDSRNPSYHALYYRANKDKWRIPPEERRIREAIRRARKQGLPSTLTAAQTESLLAIGQATYPGEKLHLDHIVPISSGGGTTRANIHAIPASLNMSKGNKLPEEVYQQLSLKEVK